MSSFWFAQDPPHCQVISILGNTLVLWTVLAHRRMWSLTNYFLVCTHLISDQLPWVQAISDTLPICLQCENNLRCKINVMKECHLFFDIKPYSQVIVFLLEIHWKIELLVFRSTWLLLTWAWLFLTVFRGGVKYIKIQLKIEWQKNKMLSVRPNAGIQGYKSIHLHAWVWKGLLLLSFISMRDRQWIFGSFYCRLNSFTSHFTVSCFPAKCHPKCLSWKRTQNCLLFSRAEQGWNCFPCLTMLLGEHLCVHAACHDTWEAQGNNDSVGATKVAQDSLGKKHK